MNNENNRQSLVSMMILAAGIGLISGVAGELFARSYFYDRGISLPLLGEINYSDGSYRGTNLIIRDAKKVIIEQNEKTRETADTVSASIVGIFKERSVQQDSTSTPYVSLDSEAGQGIILTSDGWIMTRYKDFKDIKDLQENYFVATSGKKTYRVKSAILDPATGSYFIKLENASDLPVRSFADNGTARVGDSLLALNWDGKAAVVQVIENALGSGAERKSDNYQRRVETSYDLSRHFRNAYIFSFSGEIAGVIDEAGKVVHISSYIPVIKGIQKSGKPVKPSLGIIYINLEHIIGHPVKKGSLVKSVEKGSAAERAGIKEGYIITSINGVEFDKDNELAEFIGNRSVDEVVSLKYINNGVPGEFQVSLGSAK